MLDAELHDVTKVYPGGVVAVDGVDLGVRSGEFFSLLGPSGCGKTTTMRMIAGLETVTGGEIVIRGEPMRNRPAHRRPTNLVFQQLALFPHLDVAGNVGFGLRIKRMRATEIARRVAAALELVRLEGYGKRWISQLSGGQQQRVAIARALVNEPAVLLLDEPLGSLDLRLRIEMQAVLKRIQHDASTTFIYVTHDQGEALAMSDRIAVMDGGRVLQVGTPADIYERPATRFVASFVGDVNLLEEDGELMAVRPEHISIGSALELEDGRVTSGRVEDAVYLGSVIRYRVRTPAGQLLLVEVHRSAPAPALAPGEAVQVGWNRSSARVLADDR